MRSEKDIRNELIKDEALAYIYELCGYNDYEYTRLLVKFGLTKNEIVNDELVGIIGLSKATAIKIYDKAKEDI